MALTAQDLIVIGKGKLIAQCSTEEFVSQATESTVLVRSPQLAVLRSAIGELGASVRDEGDSLVVSGMDIAKIGELAAAKNVALHELSPQRGSLEEAFIQLTGDAVEYHAALGIDDSAASQPADLMPLGK
jgi:ABC-2 type transport system ATP-binding protein